MEEVKARYRIYESRIKKKTQAPAYEEIKKWGNANKWLERISFSPSSSLRALSGYGNQLIAASGERHKCFDDCGGQIYTRSALESRFVAAREKKRGKE